MIFFDKFNVKTYAGVQPWLPKANQELEIDHGTGNIYKELFDGLIYYKYHVIRAENSLAGVSTWQNMKNYNNKESVIYHKGKELPKYDFDYNSYLILKNKKIMTNGYVSTVFYMGSVGRVGFLFKFYDIKHYYIFEKVVEKDKQYYQIGRVNIKYSLLLKVPITIPTLNKWMSVKIEFKDYKYKIAVKEESPKTKYFVIYEGEDFNLKNSYIGLSAASKNVAFSELTMQPNITYFKDQPKFKPSKTSEISLLKFEKIPSKESLRNKHNVNEKGTKIAESLFDAKSNSKKDKINWNKCIKSNIIKREKYCKETFGFSGTGMYKCHVSYNIYIN